MVILLVRALYPTWTGNLIVCPGSQIPHCFDNPSVGDSITMELPLPLCRFWRFWIFAKSRLPYWLWFFENWISGVHETLTVGHLESQHLWHFNLSRNDISHPMQLKGKEDGSCSHRFSFKSHYRLRGSPDKFLETSSIIKKCGVRERFGRIQPNTENPKASTTWCMQQLRGGRPNW